MVDVFEIGSNHTVGKAVLLFVYLAVMPATHSLVTTPESEYDNNNNIQVKTNDYHTYFFN